MFNRFKNSIVGKIMLGYGVIILLAFITTLVSMYSAWQNRKIDQLVSDAYYPMVLTLKETEMMASETYKLTNNWIYQPNVEEKEKLKTIHAKEAAVQKEKLAIITDKFDDSVATEGQAILTSLDALLLEQAGVMNILNNDTSYSNDITVDAAITAMDKKITPSYQSLNELITQATANLNKLLDDAKEQKESSSRMLSYLYISNIVLFLLIGIYATYFSISYITKPIAGLSELITTLSKGKFVSVTLKKGKDEIGKMAEAIEDMLTGLKGKVEFAENIGKGNYESNFQLLSEDDTMGGALIQMRDNLKQAADEDRKRNWSTEGLAKFADILRSGNDNLSQLSDSIISNLVKYMGVNQGALFLVNDDNPQDTYIELVACYAYNRKKYLNKRIELGEGITGQCILEKDTIYISDVPDDYLKITSGLGDALPKNLLIVPLKLNESIFGVVEIASFQIIEPYQIEFVQKLGESIASTISSVKVNSRTKKLLEETQVQAEQMRAQEEEMRQNMEELSATQEEMHRVVKEVEAKEAYTSEMLNVSTDLIYTVDKSYKLVSWNKPFAISLERFGMQLGKGTDTLSWFSDEESKKKQTALYNRVFNGETVEDIAPTEINGVTYYFQSINTPLRNNHQEIIEAAVFSKDVTEATVAKMKVQQMLADSQQQTEELKAQEEELRQNMEELAATQEEMERRQTEINTLLEKFNLATNTTTEGLWDMIVPKDMEFKDNTVFNWSDRFRHMLGYTNEFDFPNVLHAWSDLLHPDHKQNTLNAFSAHLLDYSGKTPYNVEYQLKLKDGTYRWFRAVGNTLRDESGKPLRIAGSLIDIQAVMDMRTLQDQLEAKVNARTSELEGVLKASQENEEYVNSLLNVSTDSILTLDRDYKVITHNKVFAATFEEKGIAVGKGFDILSIFDEQEKARKIELYDKVFKGQSIQITDHLSMEGFDNYFAVNHSPLRNGKGEIFAISIFARDITSLIKTQHESEKLNEIMKERDQVYGLTTLLSESDEAGNITFVNDKLCKVSKYSRKELIGKPLSMLNHPDMPDELFKRSTEALKKGELFSGIFKYVTKQGGYYWAETTTVPVKNERGEVVKYVSAGYPAADVDLAVIKYNRQAAKLKLPTL